MAYLIEAVWEQPPAAAQSNVRTYITGLRRALKLSGQPADRIVIQSGGYLLEREPGELDATRFADLVSIGDAALDGGAPDAALVHFERALELWRGRPLEDLSLGGPTLYEVARLEELRLHAIRRKAKAAALVGQHSQAVSALRELTVERPLDEGLWADLMSALAAAGRRAEVLSCYAQIRRRLIEDLGIEPGWQLRHQHQRALAGDL